MEQEYLSTEQAWEMIGEKNREIKRLEDELAGMKVIAKGPTACKHQCEWQCTCNAIAKDGKRYE